MKQTILTISILGAMLSFNVISAQDFMFQGWYWDYPKAGCNGVSSSWASNLQSKAAGLGQAGFTYVWLPPPTNASSGQCSNGYDPRDLYDLGEFSGPTGLGTRTELDNLITAFNNNGMEAVADVVFNHRDGGVAESNPAVKDYITTYYDISKSPFPSDRFYCVLPLGGTSGNGAGTYYIKVKSKTQHSNYHGWGYKIYAQTGEVGWQNLADDTDEEEPNGGGDCGTGGNGKVISLGRNYWAQIDDGSDGCFVDEFVLTLSAADFDAAGDELELYITNTGGYSDHYIYGIWSGAANADVVGQLDYRTWTNFYAMPSGQGGMNFESLRPNSNTASTEQLNGFWNWPWFFYDYDQSQASTQTTLYNWSDWLLDDVGFGGLRMDAVKHFDPAFIGDLMDHLYASGNLPGMTVGEFYDGDPAALSNWITQAYAAMNTPTKAAADLRVFDFTLRQKLKDICDNNANAPEAFTTSLAATGVSPSNIVTFLNNHDFRDAFGPVYNDLILAYAYLLTNNQIGLPCVYYPEYFGVQPNVHHNNVYLKPQIDELISIHQTYIYTSPRIEYLNGGNYYTSFLSGSYNRSMVYQMQEGVGGKDIIVAINFSNDAMDLWQGINLNMDGVGANDYGVGQTFTEVTNGYAITPTLSIVSVVDGEGRLNIQLPPKSYAVWVEGAVLPLELTAFTAKKKNNDAVLNWEVERVSGVTGFEIERSYDGHDFNVIAFSPINMDDQLAAYQYVDQKVNPQATNVYYRLKIVDEDGSFEYSAIEKLNWSNQLNTIQVYPNPFKDNLNIQINNNKRVAAEVLVFDLTGKKVMKKGVFINGNVPFELSMSNIEKGIYFLQLLTNDGVLWSGKVEKM